MRNNERTVVTTIYGSDDGSKTFEISRVWDTSKKIGIVIELYPIVGVLMIVCLLLCVAGCACSSKKGYCENCGDYTKLSKYTYKDDVYGTKHEWWVCDDCYKQLNKGS